jgi:hypothetical protein
MGSIDLAAWVLYTSNARTRLSQRTRVGGIFLLQIFHAPL